MVILGSANSLIGPILGAAFFLAFRDVLSDFTEHWMLFFGPLLVARVLLVKDGIWGMLLRATGAGECPGAPEVDCPELVAPGMDSEPGRVAMSEFVLEIHHLRKAFGALIATDDLTLSIRKGETHALIGPNGAGKTTLVGQLTGELRPDAGRITFDGRDITDLPTARRARLGLARSFQITSIFDSFTAEGNVALAVQATEPHSFRFWTPAERIARLRQPARRLLADVGPRRSRPSASHPGCRTANTASSSSAWRSLSIQ